MSCHSATANQVRLALHTAAYWLMLAVRDAIPRKEPLAKAEFATIRERLIKIGARVIEHLARIRIQLPTSCPEGRLFRAVALRLAPSGMSGGASRPDAPPSEADQPQTRCTASGSKPVRADRPAARVRRADVQKWAAWCMIRANVCGWEWFRDSQSGKLVELCHFRCRDICGAF